MIFPLLATTLPDSFGRNEGIASMADTSKTEAPPSSTLVGPAAAEIRAIAKEAYIYAYPMVDSYRILYAYYQDRSNPEFKAPWNVIFNAARVYTPEDRAVQTPNSDTPYSMIGMDLRAEPLVLTVPPIEGGRYFSIQLVDAYTHNFDYIGSRATGNGGGSFMVAGPNWSGQTPPGIAKVYRCETDIALAIYRTQLFSPADLDNVRRIQAGYQVQGLSAFAGTAAPPAAPVLSFPPPLRPDEQRTSAHVLRLLNFVLGFCPTHSSEQALMQRFARIGVGAGRDFDPSRLPDTTRQAIEQGIADAWADYEALHRRINGGEISSGALFGTREHLRNNYLYRMAAAVLGIFGNSVEEAMYPIFAVDDAGQPLSGEHRYAVRFAPGLLPPVNAFWSLTMYELPSSLLVANPLNRYLLNSTMLSQFKRDPDGGLTFHVQHDSPGAERETNWLPAPRGRFMVALRLYWPKAEVLDGRWRPPGMSRVG